MAFLLTLFGRESMMWMTRGWRIRGWRWKTFGKHLWTKVNADDVLNRAAILSFYFLLALFPLLLFLTALPGYFADAGKRRRWTQSKPNHFFTRSRRGHGRVNSLEIQKGETSS
ncbi:MAG: hypothetical protein M3Y84_13940 [Acidobacteriota bacterium]|nr:hypothetical protein [Acidobacteriota bacterium]